MKLLYSDQFVLPLPDGHRFPMVKYRMLREGLSQLEGFLLEEAPLATRSEILLAHESDYVERVFSGQITLAEQREIGFPWSPEMVERSCRSAGATIAACQTALIEGVAANLAGGTHHAYAHKGSGFCVFNDSVIAARVIQKEVLKDIERLLQVLVIDLDVHQGDGTASILEGDDSIFTFSMHAQRNYPFQKEKSDLDIALPDQCGDMDYLDLLAQGLKEVDQRFMPELIIYLAGADPYEGDRLGRLSLSMSGLFQRDQYVFNWARDRHIPVAITMAGGYAHQIQETVAVHAQTIKTARGYQWV